MTRTISRREKERIEKELQFENYSHNSAPIFFYSNLLCKRRSVTKYNQEQSIKKLRLFQVLQLRQVILNKRKKFSEQRFNPPAKRYPTRLNSYKHKMSQTPALPCNVCDKQFNIDTQLSEHLKTHLKPFKCDICLTEFKQICHLQQHQRIHNNERPYKCKECSQSFRQSVHLLQHRRVHTGETPYRCDYCDRSFKQKVHVIQHTRIHTGEKPYHCDGCGKDFRQHSHLKKHLEKYHIDSSKLCECEICGNVFKDKKALKKHKLLHNK